MKPIPVIIDTDPGVDDALALLLALRSPELQVVAITTVCGNVGVRQATRNLFKVLQLMQPSPMVLIGHGADRPLEEPLQTALHVHGLDGLGELARFRNADGSPRYPEPHLPLIVPTALQVWTDCLRRYDTELVLITLGPLTNLARALQAERASVNKFRTVICVGGTVESPGNVTAAAEFNIYADPHAAQQVFAAGLPITLVPLDVTTRVTLDRQELDAMTRDSHDPAARFVHDATERLLAYTEEAEGQAKVYFHEALAIGVAIDPTLVNRVPLHLEVETEGRFTRGMTVADRRPLRVRPPANLHVALTVDAPRFLGLFGSRLTQRGGSFANPS
jgi:purine nucleosidase/pyrimidine-specific ribonucleoside hydrolase